MDREQLNKLLEQYDEAQSSLDNERALMKYAKIIGHSISSWSEFVKHQKKVVPAGLQDDLWKAIEQREKRKQKFTLRWISAAASVIIIIAFSLTLNRKNNEMSLEEKQILLQEALNMFSSETEEQITKEIIYEDELVVIYTDIKKKNDEKVIFYN